MSLVIIRQQLEVAVAALTPAIDTELENGPTYTPTVGRPYQRVNLLFGTPQNPTLGDNFYREIGFVQITLCYPQGKGSGDADARAQLIRNAFPQGRSFVAGKVTTIISGTMAKAPGATGGSRTQASDHFETVCKVPFFSNVLP